jgi:hypothetical protein
MAKIDQSLPLNSGLEPDLRVSRRRALIAGLAATPVVLTLLNRSAWGANCSNATVASFQQGGNVLTASFTRRHPNATINSGENLKC